MRSWVATVSILLFLLLSCGSEEEEVAHIKGIRTAGASPGDFRILVLVRTRGFRHPAIPDAIAALEEIGGAERIAVDTTEDDTKLDDARLGSYRVLVFLMTSGDVLDAGEEAAVERFVRNGGGFVGLHSATDTEHAWPFHDELVGARFVRHSAVEEASVIVEDTEHVATRDLPRPWQRIDEWYDFASNPRARVHVLLTVDERTYEGGTMGADHPIAWTRELDRGRSFITSLGHPAEAWRDELLRKHVKGGLLWAAQR